MNVAQAIRERLSGLAPSAVELTDESGAHVGHDGARDGGGHYRLTVVSERFRGLTRVERHRLVYSELQLLMGREIHALALRALSPDEL